MSRIIHTNNLSIQTYFCQKIKELSQSSDARRTFVGCRPNNCVRVVIYIRMNMYFWEISTNNRVTNRIEIVLVFQSWKDSEIYITGNRNVFCHIFSLSFFRYLLLYLRSKLYRQNFIRVLKGLSTTHTESLLKKNYVVGSAGRGGSSDTATAVALHEDGTVASLIEDCRQKSVPVHIRFLLSTIGSKRFIAKVGSVLSSANNYAISLTMQSHCSLQWNGLWLLWVE